MKSVRLKIIVPLLLIGLSMGAKGAAFDSGSTGADGPLHVTNNLTLPLPPNGVFNFTTIEVDSSATLRFSRNEFNTPVFLLATGNVTINGSIDVSGYPALSSVGGEGGPGGFDGGNPSAGGLPPSDGYGPGGGNGGTTSFGSIVTDSARSGTYAVPTSYSVSNQYGNVLLDPLVGGSGGGGNTIGGGGGGGGAILIASSTQISIPAPNTSRIVAYGGSGSGSPQFGSWNYGSGGAIRLVAPRVTGSGWLHAYGQGVGGEGRIRIDTQDRSELFFNFAGRVSVGANMTLFSSPISRLDIVEVAGRAIPFGTNSAARIQLPLNSPTNQSVKITATDFIGPVNLEVVVTPDNGPALRFPASFDMGNTNRITTTVNVIIPPDVPCRVSAWTR